MKKWINRTIGSVLTATLMFNTGCAGAKPTVDPIDDNYRVFYEIFVGSFSDSDGDGVGDLRGIINRLDYLNDGDINSGKSLGIQGIWLSPIFSSPSYHKYDVENYLEIDDKFGTTDELTELIDECHKRNVKVIIDFVINHTSDKNVWFTRFVTAHKNGNTEDKYYNYYSWATKETRVAGLTYQPIPGCDGEYYECNFSGSMPELNYDNEDVRKLMLDLAKYWLDIGVDGFRFDAIKYIYYNDTPKSADFWEWYMDELRGYKEDIYCVGECWSGDNETLAYVGGLNCFNFQIAQAEGFVANAVKRGDIAVFTNYVESYQDKVQAANADYGMPISFISNHDMDRSAGYLMMANNWPQMAANLYLLSPGSPFIYYGEEIGAKGTRGGANTDANRRLAMNWGDDDTIDDPIGADYAKSKQTNGTAEAQIKNADSLYNYYREVIALRNKYPAIARGDYKSLRYDITTFGGFEITYKEETIYLFHNTMDTECVIDLTKGSGNIPDSIKVLDFIGQGNAKLSGKTLTLGPQTSVILK